MHRKWYRLDTAALIFPAIARRDWCNAFRVSATLTEAVDPEILQQAVSDLRRHFPNFFVTLRKGFFWYYLEESPEPVSVRGDYAYPLTFMGSRELKRNCLRVLYYKNRIAAEFFHALTDGHGGSVFLCSLTARYLELRYGLDIPKDDMVRALRMEPAHSLEEALGKAEEAVGRHDAKVSVIPDGVSVIVRS